MTKVSFDWLRLLSNQNILGFTTAGVACKNGRIKILQWMVTNIDSVAAELQPKGNDYKALYQNKYKTFCDTLQFAENYFRGVPF